MDAKVTLLALMLVAASPGEATAGPTFDPERLPYRAAWGPYAVVAERFTGADGVRQRVRIVGGTRLTVREVRGHTISLVAFEELTGRPPSEVRIDVYSGGAHCCLTTYVFTRKPEVRNLFIFNAGNGGIVTIRDLDGDGRPEVEAANDALAYLGEIPFALDLPRFRGDLRLEAIASERSSRCRGANPLTPRSSGRRQFGWSGARAGLSRRLLGSWASPTGP